MCTPGMQPTWQLSENRRSLSVCRHESGNKVVWVKKTTACPLPKSLGAFLRRPTSCIGYSRKDLRPLGFGTGAWCCSVQSLINSLTVARCPFSTIPCRSSSVMRRLVWWLNFLFQMGSSLGNPGRLCRGKSLPATLAVLAANTRWLVFISLSLSLFLFFLLLLLSRQWGRTSGGVYVPYIYTRVRWELP